MRTLVCAVVFTAIALPALAQTERLPLTSRGEAYLNEMNRSVAVQQQLRALSQQTQFEINQLRMEVQRARQFPRGGCPPGWPGC